MLAKVPGNYPNSKRACLLGHILNYSIHIAFLKWQSSDIKNSSAGCGLGMGQVGGCVYERTTVETIDYILVVISYHSFIRCHHYENLGRWYIDVCCVAQLHGIALIISKC